MPINNKCLIRMTLKGHWNKLPGLAFNHLSSVIARGISQVRKVRVIQCSSTNP